MVLIEELPSDDEEEEIPEVVTAATKGTANAHVLPP